MATSVSASAAIVDPDKHVTVSQAATMIGAPSRSLHRTIQAIKSGAEPARTSNKWQLPVAKLFVRAREEGRDVTIRGIFQIVGLPDPTGPVAIQLVGQPPRKPKQIRTRNEPVTNALAPLDAAATATSEEKRGARTMLDELIRSYDARKVGRPPWKQITDIVIWLKAAGEQPPGGKLLGHTIATLTHENRPRFGTIGDFINQGRADDIWIFVLTEEGARPRDLLVATTEEILFGHIVPLTLRDWSKALIDALTKEERGLQAGAEAEEMRRYLSELKKIKPVE